jgi:hypothetical protein
MKSVLHTNTARSSRRGRAIAIFAGLLLSLGVTGCNQPPPSAPETYVIQCGGSMISKAQFGDELDLKLSAYPFNLKTDPERYNAVVLDLISVLSDEILILEAARAQGILVGDDEIARAESAVREDYPEDSFEQMLLENAIPYAVWKKKLIKDLVIDKFIRSELIRAQEITPDDVMTFYQKHAEPANAAPSPAMDEQELIRQLRVEKSQAAYEDWMTALKKTYGVEINKEAVAAFLEKTK